VSALDPIDAYADAAALFGRVLTGLADQEWDLPTWPEGWTVVTTVAWVVVGDSQVPVAVAGSRLDPPRDFDAGILGTNPVATWRGTALAAMAALRTPGALGRRTTLSEGELAVADLVAQRVTENLVRGHDIARTVGRDVEFVGSDAAQLADWCLDFWSGHRDAVMSGTVLPAPPVEPAPDATGLERLLALTGRPVAGRP
jgi:uncharacterized protein (TIGR03086 family)